MHRPISIRAALAAAFQIPLRQPLATSHTSTTAARCATVPFTKTAQQQQQCRAISSTSSLRANIKGAGRSKKHAGRPIVDPRISMSSFHYIRPPNSSLTHSISRADPLPPLPPNPTHAAPAQVLPHPLPPPLDHPPRLAAFPLQPQSLATHGATQDVPGDV